MTWLGTLAQVEHGLHEVQKRYFESYLLVHWLGPVPIPLPGANLVLTLLFANLAVGGIARLRRDKNTIGVLIAHVGIGILLISGFVKHAFSQDGHITLFEGQSARWFESFYRFELAIARETDDGRVEEFLVPHEDLVVAEQGPLRLTAPELPFDLEITDWLPNCRPLPKGPMFSVDVPVVDGVFLSREPLDREAERNLAGAYVSAVFRSGGRADGILWSVASAPWTVADAGERWAIELRKERYPIPFELTLEDFRKEDHPRTAMPRSFESDVTVARAGTAGGRSVLIEMNEPLRTDGLVLYQASWGPANARPGEPLFSTFAVVRNPADAWPLVGCIVIAFGLLVHFSRKLARWMRRSFERRGDAPVAEAASVARRAAAILALTTLAGAAEAQGEPAYEWSDAVVELASSLPVQDGGRVKPLSTYANFTLLRLNGKRSVTLADGDRRAPVPWILDVLFRPDAAARYPTFLIEDDAVVRALDLELDDKKKRDRYSYEELAPGVGRLFELAHEYGAIPSAERTGVEEQIVRLAGNVDSFLTLARHFDFARYGVVVDESELTDFAFEAELVPLSTILTLADRLGATADPAAREVLDSAAEIARTSNGLALIPPLPHAHGDGHDHGHHDGHDHDDGATAWLSPADLALAAQRGLPVAGEHAAVVANFEALYLQRDDAAAFERELSAAAASTRRLAERRGDLGKIDLERTYYRIGLVGWSLRGFVVAFLAVALVWLRPRARWPYRIGAVAASAATLALVGAIVVRCVIRARPPVSTLYETVLFVTATGVLVALFLEWVGRRRIALSAAAVLGLVGVFVANGYETLDKADTMPSLVAVLDTNFWLATHVTAITLGYSAGMLAALLASFFLVIDLFRPGARRPPIAGELARMVYGVTCFALFFSLVGTILGGIWANDSWGRFWGWDPKENGALLIVIAQTAILHGRIGGYLKQRGLCMAAAFGGTVVAFSWWGVNLLGVGLHSYGFTSGIHEALWTYYAIQWSIVGLGAWSAWSDRRRAAPA